MLKDTRAAESRDVLTQTCAVHSGTALYLTMSLRRKLLKILYFEWEVVVVTGLS